MDAKTTKWLEARVICAGDSELAGYEEKILLKIKELGYGSFKEFLAAHSIDEKLEIGARHIDARSRSRQPA